MASDNIFTTDGQAQTETGPRRENLFAEGFLATNAYAELAEMAAEAAAPAPMHTEEIEHTAPLELTAFDDLTTEETGDASVQSQAAPGPADMTADEGQTEIGHDGAASVQAMTSDVSVEPAQTGSVTAPESGAEASETPVVQDNLATQQALAPENEASAQTELAESGDSPLDDPTLVEFDYRDSEGEVAEEALHMAENYEAMTEPDNVPVTEGDSAIDAATGIVIGQDFDWNDII